MSGLRMALKHLSKGSQWPSLQPDKLRLYSMHFCPYAQRTRLVLAHKKIPHELINVNLKFKADWFVARNPMGLVPVLEYNGHVVSESIVCDDFLEEMYPQISLYPKDPYLRAMHKTVIVQFEKLAEAFGQLKSTNPERKERAKKSYVKRIGIFENMLTDTYFAGFTGVQPVQCADNDPSTHSDDHPTPRKLYRALDTCRCNSPGMVDFHIWPWYERIPALEKLSGMNLLPEDQYPKLNAWMKAMLQLPAVKEILIPDDQHMQFFVSFATGTPNYDAAYQASL